MQHKHNRKANRETTLLLAKSPCTNKIRKNICGSVWISCVFAGQRRKSTRCAHCNADRAGVPLHGNEKISTVRKQLQAASASNSERAFNVIARNMRQRNIDKTCICKEPVPTQTARCCLTCGGKLSKAFKDALIAAYDKEPSLADAVRAAMRGVQRG